MIPQKLESFRTVIRNLTHQSKQRDPLAAMGVNDLWKVLAKSERKTPLNQLSGHVLAVDLSGWVCQASTYSKLAS